MSAQVAAPVPAPASEKTVTTMAAAAAAWPYVEYMARWERQVERRQLFLRSYHFSRDADHHHHHHLSPRARARRVVWAGARRLRRATATGLRRLRARIRLCFGWAARRRSSASSPPSSSRRARTGQGFRYGRLHRATAGKAAPAGASVCFW